MKVEFEYEYIFHDWERNREEIFMIESTLDIQLETTSVIIDGVYYVDAKRETHEAIDCNGKPVQNDDAFHYIYNICSPQNISFEKFTNKLKEEIMEGYADYRNMSEELQEQPEK